MPFLKQLETDIHLYEGWERNVLDYLLKYAVGRANAKTWKEIEENCNLHPDHDVLSFSSPINRTRFNLDLISKTRENGIFICSSDKKPKGFWIAQCMSDVIDMRDFYRKGIDAMSKNLNALDRFVTEEFVGYPKKKEIKSEPKELKYIREREEGIKCIRKNCHFSPDNKIRIPTGLKCYSDIDIRECVDYIPNYNLTE